MNLHILLLGVLKVCFISITRQTNSWITKQIYEGFSFKAYVCKFNKYWNEVKRVKANFLKKWFHPRYNTFCKN